MSLPESDLRREAIGLSEKADFQNGMGIAYQR